MNTMWGTKTNTIKHAIATITNHKTTILKYTSIITLTIATLSTITLNLIGGGIS